MSDILAVFIDREILCASFQQGKRANPATILLSNYRHTLTIGYSCMSLFAMCCSLQRHSKLNECSLYFKDT